MQKHLDNNKNLSTKRYIVDNLPLSEEAQLALFEKKDAKKWILYSHQAGKLSGKAWDIAKEKGWI